MYIPEAGKFAVLWSIRCIKNELQYYLNDRFYLPIFAYTVTWFNVILVLGNAN